MRQGQGQRAGVLAAPSPRPQLQLARARRRPPPHLVHVLWHAKSCAHHVLDFLVEVLRGRWRSTRGRDRCKQRRQEAGSAGRIGRQEGRWHTSMSDMSSCSFSMFSIFRLLSCSKVGGEEEGHAWAAGAGVLTAERGS